MEHITSTATMNEAATSTALEAATTNEAATEALRVAARDAATFYLDTVGDEFDPDATDWHIRAFDLALTESVGDYLEPESKEYAELYQMFTETLAAELSRLCLLQKNARAAAEAARRVEREEMEREAADESDDDENQDADDEGAD